MDPAAIVGSAFVLGLAGSAHCVGMCGGIAGALTQISPAARPFEGALRSLLQSTGRVASYAVAGALAGAFGEALLPIGRASGPWLRLALGLAIVLFGIQLARSGRAAPALERLGQVVWRRAAPLLRRIGRPEHAWQHLALGAVWGWLPCGLVYSALLLAAASGGPRTGALALAAFGLGTLPAVLAAAGFGRLLARIGGGASLRRTAGVLLVVFGLWSILGPWAMQQAHGGAHGGAQVGGPDGRHIAVPTAAPAGRHALVVPPVPDEPGPSSDPHAAPESHAH